MSLGKGIAITGIWVGAGLMTVALAFGGVIGEVAAEHRAITLAAPAIAAGAVTFFMLFFDAFN